MKILGKACARARAAILSQPEDNNMEFLNFVLIFVIAWILLRKPEGERLAFRLLIVSVLLMVSLYLLATRTSILPGLNY